jgi:hypothetical protein
MGKYFLRAVTGSGMWDHIHNEDTEITHGNKIKLELLK